MYNTLLKIGFQSKIVLLLLSLCSSVWGGEVATLPNGMRVVSETRGGTRSVAVQLWIRAGSREEQQGEEGAAHFVEHLVFKGTTTRKTGETDMELELMGGVWKAATGPDYVRYETRVAPEALAGTLSLLADFAQHAEMPESELAHEREILLDELALHSTQDQNLLLDLFYIAFAPMPYRHSPGGTPEAITSLKRDTLLNFYRRNYTPAKSILVLAGEIDAKQANASAMKYFGDWKPATATLPSPFNLPATIGRLFEVQGQSEAESLALGYPVPSTSNPLHLQWAKELLNTRLRAKTAPLEINIQYTPRLDTNFLLVTAKARSLKEFDALAQLKNILQAECANLAKSPPTKAEMLMAQSHIQTQEALEQETLDSLANKIGYSALLQNTPVKPPAPPTVQEIQKLFQDYFYEEQLFVLHLRAKGQL